MKKFFINLSLLVLAFSAGASEKGAVPQATLVMEGLGTPWGMAFLSAETLLVSVREGKLYEINLASKTKKEISGVPEVSVRGQGGLLDIVLDPKFAENRTVYFTYARKVASGKQTTTVLAKAQLTGGKLTGLQELLVVEPATDHLIHYGSRLAIDKDSSLWMSVGDRNERQLAQKLDTHLGKVLRLTLSGQAHPNNPFVKTAGAKPEVYSYGHRNPQGLSLDEQGQVWVHEHGPRGGDEINLIKAGANYGWPIITYGREYWGPSIGEGTHKEGMEQPVHKYVPSIAPSGLMIYQGARWPQWKGSFFLGALAGEHVNRVEIREGKFIREERLFEQLEERVRHVASSPEGEIYFATDAGKIHQVVVPRR
jgi:glucose/arabinose dehydrogenase